MFILQEKRCTTQPHLSSLPSLDCPCSYFKTLIPITTTATFLLPLFTSSCWLYLQHHWSPIAASVILTPGTTSHPRCWRWFHKNRAARSVFTLVSSPISGTDFPSLSSPFDLKRSAVYGQGKISNNHGEEWWEARSYISRNEGKNMSILETYEIEIVPCLIFLDNSYFLEN